MTTRRQFLTTSASAAVAAALLPTAPAAAADAETPAAGDARAAEASAFRSEMKRYATMAALAQSVPAPDA